MHRMFSHIVSCQFFLGLPLLRFPSGLQSMACTARLSPSILATCPIQSSSSYGIFHNLVPSFVIPPCLQSCPSKRYAILNIACIYIYIYIYIYTKAIYIHIPIYVLPLLLLFLLLLFLLLLLF